MRILLGLVSAACLLVFAAFLFLHVANVVGYSAEGTDTDITCTTPVPAQNTPTIQRCVGREEAGAAISNAVYGGAALVAGAGFAVAAAVAGWPKQPPAQVVMQAPAGQRPGPGPRSDLRPDLRPDQGPDQRR
ncbi:hypothetical protein [Nocardioides zeae]|uniref:Uncharacterized protein n=1 Tax=Nocardioides zeae TaxID=1457234 RepID=A0A6P0HNS7_9ACTN|nr:hypothetical protein [Nocardioides zeae]NEN80291.1 hypothetical protein [Nocardioides zeae]